MGKLADVIARRDERARELEVVADLNELRDGIEQTLAALRRLTQKPDVDLSPVVGALNALASKIDGLPAPKPVDLRPVLDAIAKLPQSIPVPPNGSEEVLGALAAEGKRIRDAVASVSFDPPPPVSWRFEVKRERGRISEIVARPA